jgi:hypothetical protein
MKRPQGNILRPPGSKYLNDKKVPGRKNVMHSAINLRIESVGPKTEHSRLWPYWHTKKPPLGWRSDGSPSTKPRTKYPHAARPKIAEDVLARLINGNRVAKKPPLG